MSILFTYLLEERLNKNEQILIHLVVITEIDVPKVNNILYDRESNDKSVI